jgi:hypothetical protein
MNDKTKEILRHLAEGKNRHDTAKILGYQSYMGLHNYMVRHNFTWNSEVENYVNSNNKMTIGKVIRFNESMHETKISSIILEFQNGMSSKDVARKFNFESVRDMADYMRIRGCFWDNSIRNYKKQQDETFDIMISVEDEITGDNEKHIDATYKFTDLLEFLNVNKEKFKLMLSEDFENGSLPRYVLCGINVTKSVHMVSTLDQLTRAYSQEKNISQREIFQIALIDFFRRYGYEKEIEVLIKKR